jgi:hypothetical protein
VNPCGSRSIWALVVAFSSLFGGLALVDVVTAKVVFAASVSLLQFRRYRLRRRARPVESHLNLIADDTNDPRKDWDVSEMFGTCPRQRP